MINDPNVPAGGLKGLVQNWRRDLIAAISVSLVAMPLCLGIAIASGVPPMSGILSAIIGGLVTTLFRSSQMTINGPGAGLIAVILGAIAALEDGTGQTLNYVLAAIVMSGTLQVLLGFFKLGGLAEIIPSSVIRGILAAIGIIIIAKQAHVALGTSSDAETTVETLLDIFRNFPEAHPLVTLISVAAILLMVYHARISYKLFHLLPAPIWVLILSIPFVYIFNFLEPHQVKIFGKEYPVGPQYLISIPDNFLDSILHPNFSKIHTGPFWLSVISITLIATVETLASTKAVDKLDPHKRKTNYDRDLMSNGLSTVISGFLGGLPIITVIVRSTVNIYNNAQTKWANFYHGVLLLVFVLLATPVIQKIPLAVLAAILVFTGYKLASPRIFRETYEQGMEQLLFFGSTLIITLFTNLLWGMFWGIVITILVHLLLARVPVAAFFRMIFGSQSDIYKKSDGNYEIKVKGIANFLSILRLNKLLEKVPAGADVKINLSTAKLVDFTVQENLQEFRRVHQNTGGQVNISGLDQHVSSTYHRFGLKSLISPYPQSLSPRQKRLKDLAYENGWTYREQADWNASYLQNFQFFDSRPIEYKANIISASYPDTDVRWELCDITFDEGALLAKEVYRTTVEIIFIDKPMPKFVLEREGFFDMIFGTVLAFSGQRDIDFPEYPLFSRKFVLMGKDEDALKEFFTVNLVRFLEQEDIYHIESNGQALLVFRSLHVSKSQNIEQMVRFSGELVRCIIQGEGMQKELTKQE